MAFHASTVDPSQLVRDAKQHGVVIRPIDVNASEWDCTLEPLEDRRCAVRLGLRMTRGLAEKDAQKIVAARGDQPFANVLELTRRAGSTSGALVRLAKADAFASMNLSRRDAARSIKALKDDELPLFAEADRRDQTIRHEQTELPVVLPAMPKKRDLPNSEVRKKKPTCLLAVCYFSTLVHWLIFMCHARKFGMVLTLARRNTTLRDGLGQRGKVCLRSTTRRKTTLWYVKPPSVHQNFCLSPKASVLFTTAMNLCNLKLNMV